MLHQSLWNSQPLGQFFEQLYGAFNVSGALVFILFKYILFLQVIVVILGQVCHSVRSALIHRIDVMQLVSYGLLSLAFTYILLFHFPRKKAYCYSTHLAWVASCLLLHFFWTFPRPSLSLLRFFVHFTILCLTRPCQVLIYVTVVRWPSGPSSRAFARLRRVGLVVLAQL